MDEGDVRRGEQPAMDIVSVLFTRLENAAMNIGRTQAFAQVAAGKANEEIQEVKANAELQQDYLLERLKQCQDAAARTPPDVSFIKRADALEEAKGDCDA